MRKKRSSGIKTLISIISPEELGGLPALPEYLDIKDPAKGPLGAANPLDISAVRRLAGPSAVISAAIGDAGDDPAPCGARAVAAGAAGADIVKAGFPDFHPMEVAPFLASVRRTLDGSAPSVRMVAGMYADKADGPFLRAFPAEAKKGGAWGCLIDTVEKRGRRLGHFLGPGPLAAFCAECRALGLVSVLAGGLTLEDFPMLESAGPDIAGFRSAVCAGERGAKGLDRAKALALFSAADRSARTGISA